MWATFLNKCHFGIRIVLISGTLCLFHNKEGLTADCWWRSHLLVFLRSFLGSIDPGLYMVCSFHKRAYISSLSKSRMWERAVHCDTHVSLQPMAFIFDKAQDFLHSAWERKNEKSWARKSWRNFTSPEWNLFTISMRLLRDRRHCDFSCSFF